MLHAAKAPTAAADDAAAAMPVREQVARINSVLVGEAVSDEAVIESLRALKAVPMTFETLEATKIGHAVGGLRKHASEQVRQLAVILYRSWKAVADEHLRSCRDASVPSSSSETPAPASRETPKDVEEHVRGLPCKVREAPALSMSDEARMAMTKRKMKDAYREAEAAKKQRRIKVVNVPTGESIFLHLRRVTENQ
jgi:hypothetical protein